MVRRREEPGGALTRFMTADRRPVGAAAAAAALTSRPLYYCPSFFSRLLGEATISVILVFTVSSSTITSSYITVSFSTIIQLLIHLFSIVPCASLLSSPLGLTPEPCYPSSQAPLITEDQQFLFTAISFFLHFSLTAFVSFHRVPSCRVTPAARDDRRFQAQGSDAAGGE